MLRGIRCYILSITYFQERNITTYSPTTNVNNCFIIYCLDDIYCIGIGLSNKTNDPVVGASWPDAIPAQLRPCTFPSHQVPLVWLGSTWSTYHRAQVLGLCFLIFFITSGSILLPRTDTEHQLDSHNVSIVYTNVYVVDINCNRYPGAQLKYICSENSTKYLNISSATVTYERQNGHLNSYGNPQTQLIGCYGKPKTTVITTFPDPNSPAPWYALTRTP